MNPIFKIIILLLLACGEAIPPAEGPLKFSVLTRSLLTPLKRIVGYSKTAARLSVIDPDLEEEADGYQVGGNYDSFTVLNGFDGIAVFSSSSLKLLSAGMSREITLSPWQHWDRASASPALRSV